MIALLWWAVRHRSWDRQWRHVGEPVAPGVHPLWPVIRAHYQPRSAAPAFSTLLTDAQLDAGLTPEDVAARARGRGSCGRGARRGRARGRARGGDSG